MKTIRRHIIAALPLVALAGCEVPELPPQQAAAPSQTAPVEAAKPGPKMVAGEDGVMVVDDSPPISDVPRPFDVRDPVKGRRSRAIGGLTANIGNAPWAIETKYIMANVAHALDLYDADKDGYPKTHDEFMKGIIEFNKLQLPKLPPDREYIYVPTAEKSTEMLQVRAVQSGGPAAAPAPETTEPAPTTPPATTESAATPAATPATPPEPESGRDEAGNPLDLRERAAALGGQAPDVEEP